MIMKGSSQLAVEDSVCKSRVLDLQILLTLLLSIELRPTKAISVALKKCWTPNRCSPFQTSITAVIKPWPKTQAKQSKFTVFQIQITTITRIPTLMRPPKLGVSPPSPDEELLWMSIPEMWGGRSRKVKRPLCQTCLNPRWARSWEVVEEFKNKTGLLIL